MKKLLLAAATMLAFAGAAGATTFNTYVTANPFRAPGQAGLQTRAVILSPVGAQNFNGASYSFNLDKVGDSTSMNLYGLVQYDAPLGVDDLIPKPSTATFDFGGLIGSITLFGTSVGVLGKTDYAIATFVSDVLRISSTQGILISIRDTIFGTDGVNFVNGRAGIGFVNATFTLATVPLPAALSLSLLALGAIGVAGRRRKSALST